MTTEIIECNVTRDRVTLVLQVIGAENSTITINAYPRVARAIGESLIRAADLASEFKAAEHNAKVDEHYRDGH